jgi:hypothetical protein
LLITSTILSGMSVIGVVVVPNGRQPRVQAVILEGTLAAPEFVDAFELRTSSTEPSEQAVDLALSLGSRLTSFEVEAAGIRVAGTTPVPRRSKAAFSRAHCEGALLLVLREAIGAAVATVDPVGAPKMLGMTKPQFEERRDGLASSGVNTDAVVGALAALATL